MSRYLLLVYFEITPYSYSTRFVFLKSPYESFLLIDFLSAYADVGIRMVLLLLRLILFGI